MSKYIHFTEEQKEQARRTDLVSFLRSRGEKLKRSGSEYEWKAGGEKVTVRGNIWYHQYEREGGDAIDFVRRFYNMDFPEAVSTLLAEQGIVVMPQEETKREKKAFTLPKVNQDMRRVYAYLLKNRFLDRDVVNHFAQAKMLYEDEEYHNAIFVGMDENGVPCHAHKRGTHTESSYKGNVENSNPDYSFHYNGTGNRLYVFEAPVDMLSFISLHKENWKEHSYVALCSVATQAAVHILKTNPQIEEVYACLDHDKAGIEGNYRIAEAVREIGKGHKLMQIPPKYKDWNESLKSLNGIEPIPSSEHPGLVRMKTLCMEMVAECDGEKIKNPLNEIKNAYENLIQIPQEQNGRISEQSLEMSKVAFLFAKKQLASMEKHYEDEQYARTLYGMYPPHHDNCGYKSRLADIRERMQEINKTFGSDKIVTESEQIKAIGNIMSLSVDCLRLHMFAEANMQKQEEGESVCQALQH